MSNKKNNLLKITTKSISKSIIKQIPIAGEAFSICDDIYSSIENENQNSRIAELEKYDGILEEVSGVTFYLSGKINNKNKIDKLSELLNNDLIECINLEYTPECMIDDVCVSDDMISVNFIDTVDQYSVNKEVDLIKDKILSYFQYADIPNTYSINIIKRKYY